MQVFKKLLHNLLKDRLLLFFGGLLLLLIALRPASLSSLPSFIHWPTIATLCALLIIMTGLQQSGLMDHLAHALMQSVHTRRGLWLTLIVFSTVSAMLLTNDIALFLIIPFTLHLNTKTSLNIRPLLIFETIAVNVGSMLTPIGNPQNIYLWQKMNIPFFTFIRGMFPLFMIQFMLLMIASFFMARAEPLQLSPSDSEKEIDYHLAAISGILLLGYLIANRFDIEIYMLGVIALVYLMFYRKLFLKTQWSLVLIFIFLFVDMGIIAHFSFVTSFISFFKVNDPKVMLALGTGYSQLISNVPATLLLSHYTNEWKYLAWGVNLGANGIIIASFANLITIRLAKPYKLVAIYHKYAISFLIISGLMTYFFLF